MGSWRRVGAWGIVAAVALATLGTGSALGGRATASATTLDAGVSDVAVSDLAVSDVAVSDLGVTHAENPSVPAGAAWTEAYFPSSEPSSNGDPVELHADVLRPADLAPGERTPVIMSIGPYFSHSGMNEDTHPEHTGPPSRFTDLIDGGDLIERRYTFVYVDLRGFGGSTGCIDWVGPGEQADVVSAVEWAAAQPWSTGAVGLYGKSYDAATGLIGIDRQPEGLKAVVAMEPNWSGYDYLVTNGIPRVQQKLTPEAYIGISHLPGVDRSYQQDGYDIPADTDHYLTNAAYEKTHPECAETIVAGTKATDRDSDFWRVRDMPANVGGSTVPLLFTQGLTEQNTTPQSMQEFLSNHAGEQRAWMGPWDHVRGNEVDSQGRLEMGRAGWFDEVMTFYDRHLVEQTSEVSSAFYLQDNLGAWRVQDHWGTTDKTAIVPLAPGTYRDDGVGAGDDGEDPDPDPNPNPLLLDDGDPDSGSAPVGDVQADDPPSDDVATGYLTVSHPVRTDVRLTGTPAVELHTEGAGNVLVQLWDQSPAGSAVMIDANVAPLSASGVTTFGLLGLDWTLQAGHSLLVRVGTISDGTWMPTPSGLDVTVTAGSIRVAVESTASDVPTEGARAPFLDTYIERYTDPAIPPVTPTFFLSAATGSIVPATGSVSAGGELTVTGTGYDPGAPVALSFAGGPALMATTDAVGALTGRLAVPAGTPLGAAVVSAVAEDGGVASVEVQVVGAASSPAASGSSGGGGGVAALAATGAGDGGAVLATGAGVLLLGGAVLLLVRRRRSAAR